MNNILDTIAQSITQEYIKQKASNIDIEHDYDRIAHDALAFYDKVSKSLITAPTKMPKVEPVDRKSLGF